MSYIYVTNWDKFQHYKNRRPSWIKLHLDLQNNQEYLALCPSDRLLLQQVWMSAAEFGNGRVRADQSALRARANLKKGSLESLNHTGFIDIRASKALATLLAPEVEKEKEIKPPTPFDDKTVENSKNGDKPKRKPPAETLEAALERHRIVRELLPWTMRERWVSDEVLDQFNPADCKVLIAAWGRSNDLRDAGQKIEEAANPRAYALAIAGQRADA